MSGTCGKWLASYCGYNLENKTYGWTIFKEGGQRFEENWTTKLSDPLGKVNLKGIDNKGSIQG